MNSLSPTPPPPFDVCIHNDGLSSFSVLSMFSSLNCFVFSNKILPFSGFHSSSIIYILFSFHSYARIILSLFLAVHFLFISTFIQFSNYLIFSITFLIFSLLFLYLSFLHSPFTFSLFLPFRFTMFLSFSLSFSTLLPHVPHCSILSYASCLYMLAAALSYIHSDDGLSSTNLANSATVRCNYHKNRNSEKG